MVSHQTPHTKTTIPAVRDSVNSHVTNMDDVYQSSPRMSRLANPRPLGDSMLAYTQRMREIAQFRKDSALLAPTDSASVVSSEAHQEKSGGLWKKRPQNPRKHYRPLSFDELVARQAKVEPNTRLLKKKNRRYSVPNKLPSPTVSPEPKNDKDKSRVHINFVSASDLIELVSFSLRSKPSRDESMKQARFEDSLKLMKESDFFGSLPSRLPVKAFEAKEEDEDKDTLMVQGFPSPRDTLKEGQKTKFLSRNVAKSRRNNEVSKNPQQDVNSEETPIHPEPNQHPNLDLLREKHFILRHPQKLRHRPKRAKRMALHRSLLTSIPEDERRRQEDVPAQAQEVHASRMPVMPTSSSLTAIKSTRKDRTENATILETKTSSDEVDTKGKMSSKDKLSKLTPIQESIDENVQERTSHKTSTESTQNSEQRKPDPGNSPRHDKKHLPLTHNGAFPRRKNTSDKSSLQNTSRAAPSELSRTRARGLTGQSLPLLAPESRVRAQKKFSKLIFLRDTTDHVYHRYS